MDDELINEISKLISRLEKLTEEYKQDIMNCTTISELKPGDRFKFSNYEWVLLGDEQDGKLAIAAKSIDDYMFDENSCNDWSESSLRKFLNSGFLKTLKKEDLLPFTSDLTSDDGLADYGSSDDFVFLLSDALYRKYRNIMPKYNTWIWTITPYSTHPDGNDLVRHVNPDGSLAYDNVTYAYGTTPAILLNPETKVSKIISVIL